MDTATSAPPALKPPKYLVCVDAREESRVALRLACMKANVRGGSVDMMHVVAPADFQTLGAIADRMREERLKEGEQLLKTLADDASRAYGVRPNLILREGPTGDEILAVALEDADVIMIVLGIAQQNTGRGKLASWLAGQLGHKLFIPLLMVPGNLTDQQLESLV
jgi:hypothetical protein